MEAITLGMATVIVFGFLPCNSILNTLSSLSEQPQMFLKILQEHTGIKTAEELI